MSIRIRTIEGVRVAVCAARSVPKDGDLYLDDADHEALAQKFARDWEMDMVDKAQAALAERDESSNKNRDWWDDTFGGTQDGGAK